MYSFIWGCTFYFLHLRSTGAGACGFSPALFLAGDHEDEEETDGGGLFHGTSTSIQSIGRSESMKTIQTLLGAHMRRSTSAISLGNVFEKRTSRTQIRGNKYVLRESYKFTTVWMLVVTTMLVYTATVFPYRLCFLEFNVNGMKEFEAWTAIERCIDVLFITDVCLNFFFSFRDGYDDEVLDLPTIVNNYFTGGFMVDFLTCVPPEVSPIRALTNESVSPAAERVARSLAL